MKTVGRVSQQIASICSFQALVPRLLQEHVTNWFIESHTWVVCYGVSIQIISFAIHRTRPTFPQIEGRLIHIRSRIAPVISMLAMVPR